MFNKERIEKRLTKTFLMVSTITALAAVIGIITMMVLVVQYSDALENYGFAQGDIGKAMFEFADTRSALRGTIGYEDQDAINVMQKQHQENKVLFQKSFEEIEKTIVSKDGRTTYDEIKKSLIHTGHLTTKLWRLAQQRTKSCAEKLRIWQSIS